MSSGADRVAHIVQTIEEGHEVQSGSGKILCRADLEDHVVGDAMRSGVLARRLDRTRGKVVADKLRFWESLGHRHRRPAVAAADISYLGAVLELPDDPVEGRKPRANQVVVVARAEEARHRAKHTAGLLAPRSAAAGTECRLDLGLVVE